MTLGDLSIVVEIEQKYGRMEANWDATAFREAAQIASRGRGRTQTRPQPGKVCELAKEKKPAFQWYPKDFLSDEHVITMTMTQRGIYISLLSLCWLHESIPNDENAAARLCGATAREMAGAWPKVAARFHPDPEDESRLRHGRLDIERTRQANWSKKSAEGGSKSKPNRKGGYGLVEPYRKPRVMEMKTEDENEDGVGKEKRKDAPNSDWPRCGWANPEDFEVWWIALVAGHPNPNLNRSARDLALEYLLHEKIQRKAFEDGYLEHFESWDKGFEPNLYQFLDDRTWEHSPRPKPESKNGTRHLTAAEINAL